MFQMTVEQLFLELKELVDKGQGNKKVILSDDTEGNGFHGCYYSVTSDPKDVKENAEGCIYESQTEDYNDLVIIG